VCSDFGNNMLIDGFALRPMRIADNLAEFLLLLRFPLLR
jgi:hypothetical protein